MPTYSMNNTNPKPVLVINGPNNTVDSQTTVFYVGDQEMIKISPEGFWVRGQLVEQDDREAKIVYNSFKQWLVASALTKP